MPVKLTVCVFSNLCFRASWMTSAPCWTKPEFGRPREAAAGRKSEVGGGRVGNSSQRPRDCVWFMGASLGLLGLRKGSRSGGKLSLGRTGQDAPPLSPPDSTQICQSVAGPLQASADAGPSVWRKGPSPGSPTLLTPHL